MSKVAVVGAGAVGTAIAYAAQIRGVCRRLALFDLDARKVRAEVLDLNHGMQFTPMAQITGSDDLAVCAGRGRRRDHRGGEAEAGADPARPGGRQRGDVP